MNKLTVLMNGKLWDNFDALTAYEAMANAIKQYDPFQAHGLTAWPV